MAQQRDAPAYQEYAASMMARTVYRVMSLEGRGLLYTLRLECWVNGSVPADPRTLARVLGYPQEQIEAALPEVLPLMRVAGDAIHCPELDDYRDHLEERRQRQSEGGRVGAAKTNGTRAVGRSAGPTGKPRLARGSLAKPSSEQPSQEQPSMEGGAVSDQWVSAYERASRGS